MRAKEGMHEVEYIAVALMPSHHTQGTASHHTHTSKSLLTPHSIRTHYYTLHIRDWQIDLEWHTQDQSIAIDCMMFRPRRLSLIAYKAGLYTIDEGLRG